MITYNGNSFDGITSKPSLDDCIEHYGVKGMKWRKVKAKITGKIKQLRNGNKKMTKAQKQHFVDRHINDDYQDNRAANNNLRADDPGSLYNRKNAL